jgi:hypothetical protein
MAKIAVVYGELKGIPNLEMPCRSLVITTGICIMKAIKAKKSTEAMRIFKS